MPARGKVSSQRKHTFTLVLNVPSSIEPFTDENLDALYEAGCDDATFGQREHIYYADFDRKVPTFAEAVISAIEQIERAVPGIIVERIEEEDLVTISEIAERAKRTRQSVWQLVKGHRGPGNFPAPGGAVGRTVFWRWSEVGPWLAEQYGDKLQIEPNAEFISAMNGLLEARRRVPRLAREERAAIAQLLKRERRLVRTL